MSVTPEEVIKVQHDADCLHDKAAVEAALDTMAEAISERLGDSNPLLLCVLTGAIIPMGHLLTRLDFPHEIDYVHASRYRGETSGGELQWYAHPRSELKGRHVLLVDDILDEGATLAALVDYCREQGAAEVLTAALVEKRHERKSGLEGDFIGLEVEDRYVFGYGMDYKGYLRNAPGIYAVKGL